MGEKLSNLSSIRTGRIARTVPNRNRRHKDRNEKFESHLKHGAEERSPSVNEETSDPAPDAPSSAPPSRGQVMDFTA